MVPSLIFCSGVNTFIDVGCIYGLTPAEKSNPIGWVSEQNSNGKVSRGFGLMLHNILMLMQPWFSLAWVSIMVRLNVFSIYFRSSLVLKTGRAISLFPYFCFWISTRYKNKCGGDLSELSCMFMRSPTTRPQHRMNQHAKGQDELVLPPFVLHRDSLRTLTLALPNLWV